MDGNKKRMIEIAKGIGMSVGEEIVIQADGAMLGHYNKYGTYHSDAYVVKYNGNGNYSVKKIHSND